MAVKLKTELPQLVIRYTLDGKNPDSNSTAYTKPILIHESTLLNAGAFMGKKLVSPIKMMECQEVWNLIIR